VIYRGNGIRSRRTAAPLQRTQRSRGRNISFALTTAQFRARSKTVTRRSGWRKLKVGEVLCAVEKGQGLKRGEKLVRLGCIKVTDVRREPLCRLLDDADYGSAEVVHEGFPTQSPSEFVEFFAGRKGMHAGRRGYEDRVHLSGLAMAQIVVVCCSTDDDEIIKQRIAGSSVRAIAKACGSSVAEVNRVIDRWAEMTVSPELRKQTLALELARLDLLQQAFFTWAMTGDVQCGALVTKIISRRSSNAAASCLACTPRRRRCCRSSTRRRRSKRQPTGSSVHLPS
jgi:hypothetical protein